MPVDGIDRSLPFMHFNQRGKKPRAVGLTEIRGPYYSPVGATYLRDLLSAAGVAYQVTGRMLFAGKGVAELDHGSPFDAGSPMIHSRSSRTRRFGPAGAEKREQREVFHSSVSRV